MHSRLKGREVRREHEMGWQDAEQEHSRVRPEVRGWGGPPGHWKAGVMEAARLRKGRKRRAG